MEKIRTHKLVERFEGEFALIKYGNPKNQQPAINYAHTDDYYVFILVEEGSTWLVVDFKEYEIMAGSVYCLLPGQVHFPIDAGNPLGWFLAIDSTFIKDEYKVILERKSFIENQSGLNDEQISELRYCLLAIQKRLDKPERLPMEQSILHDLLSYYVGMVVEIYQHDLPVSVNNRLAAITFQFKSLLAAHYQVWKRPSEYAAKLNISPVYLNEAVKKTTGLTVSEWIQNEIILQAKRLLFYTDMSIKEIALQLGYEDWAYFTRLFTKVSAISPTQFRKRYLK